MSALARLTLSAARGRAAAAPAAPEISVRAKAIAKELIRTERAAPGPKLDYGLLRLERFDDGFYWISLDGTRLLRGPTLLDAEELQPKFIDDMERTGR
jgi:hypothetical protein